MDDVQGRPSGQPINQRYASSPATIGEVEVESWLDSGEVAARWHGRYRALLIGSDIICIGTALLVTYVIRFGALDSTAAVRNLGLVELGIGVVWLASLYAFDSYAVRRVVSGPEEWRRLVRAGALAAGLCIAACYYLRQDLARGFITVVFPLGIVLLTMGRLSVRHVVRLRRRSSDWHHRILAVGTKESVRHLVETSARAKSAGLVIVGACVDDQAVGSDVLPGVPVVGTVSQAADRAASLGTDVVALAGDGLGPARTRELSWKLEGTGRGLVMAHGLSDIAGPRLHVSPIEGMPLVWVDQPQFSGPTRRLKRVFDVIAALVGLVVLSPLLALVALAVRITSAGPVLFTQSRLGLNGDEFMVLKFRTMLVDSERRRSGLLDSNETDGALFKMRDDPRITPLGRWLRKLSVDELPQLWNVIRGDMSLVGPRPLATADSTYTGHARRRLLVRPGITGLWQVSGRSDVSWDEAVRLDLYYVENWSLGLDLSLIARTVAAVLLRRGAY